MKLQGELFNRFAFNALHDSRAGEALGDLKSTQLIWSSKKPLTLGKGNQLNFSGAYIDIVRQGAIENKSSSVSAILTTPKGTLGIDSAHLKVPDGKEHKEHSIQLGVNDKSLQGSLRYTIRDSELTDVNRSLGAALRYRMSDTSALVFNYTHRPTNEKNQILPFSLYNIAYKTKGREGLSWEATLGSHYDYDAKFRATRFEIGASGMLKSGAQLSAQLGAIFEDRNGKMVPFGVFGLVYDHKISNENFISLATQYQRFAPPGQGNWTVKLDLKYRF